MNAQEIPTAPPYQRHYFNMADLLDRVSSPRARWVDLPKEAGVYVVYTPTPPIFQAQTALQARSLAEVTFLQNKWQATQPTDILYIGKASNIRQRVRALVRFGVGKAKNHRGGEWLWQVANIRQAKLLTQTCPTGQDEPFESYLLAQFKEAHGQLPLANRKEPRAERWCP